jgi:protein O-GlcNAc transferase
MPQVPLQQAFDLALQHQRAGRLPEAERIYRQILAQNPNHIDSLLNLGILAQQLDRNDLAVEFFRRAVALNPNYTKAYSNLSVALRANRRLDDSIVAGRRAIALNPDLAPAYANLANALADAGRLTDAIAAARRAVELDPNLPQAHSNLITLMHYHPDFDSTALALEKHRFNLQYAEPLRNSIRPHDNDRASDRPLKIGYVSVDFRDHAVGRSILSVLQHHDRENFHATCYAHQFHPDAVTFQIKSAAGEWRDISRLSDAQAADLIRRDQVDILIDLMQHTAGNRLLIFARKPAPVQATYLGYCASTGLAAIDYRLSDPHLDPPDSIQPPNPERTIRLSQTYWCYQPLPPTPDPSPLPADSTGHITFGCLNNFAKITAALDLWADILQSVPNSRLLLHSPPGTHLDELKQKLAAKGISSERLLFVDRQPWHEYLAAYNQIDIALDTFPWTGGITTCDALYMGVPVVTLAGQSPISRGGVSILTNLGLAELIAHSPREYLSIASTVAGDFSRLANLRSILRRRMERSPLMNAQTFTRDIESAYRQMWQRYCAAT